MALIKDSRRIKIPVRMSRKLRWGVSGCGHFMETVFLPTLQMLKKNRLISVYSSKLDRAKYIKNKFGGEGAYNNFDEFLQSNFDAVYIGSANNDHYEQVLKSAAARKHILCEKPLSITSTEAAEMVKACDDNKVFLTVNYVHRFHPLVIKAKELMEKQMLGKIVSISANFNIDYAPNDNFRFKKALSGGGALRDLGTHMIDLLRYYGGEISEISGFVDNIVYKSEVDDFAAALVKFEKGGYGYFNISYNTKKAFNRIEMLGHKGCMSIDNLIARKNVSSKLTINLDGEAKKAFRKRGNKLAYLLRSVQKSFLKNIPPLVTGYDGLINMKLMEELERKCL